MDKQTLLLKAEANARAVWQRLRALYPALTGTCPKIVPNARLKTTAGRCFIETRVVDLSVDLLLEYPEQMLYNTLPHELAHQAAWDLFQDPGHGKPWKSVMIRLGLPPERCHQMTNTRWAARRAGA